MHPPPDGDRVIVVVKKKKHRGGHHGGSWKVAYADFVTAMMAFFLVMWIVGMESGAKDLVEGYFNNPVGFRRAYGGGTNPIAKGSLPIETNVQSMPLFIRQVEERRFGAVRDQILRQLGEEEGTRGTESLVEVVVTPDGLRVELVEDGSGDTFFALGGAEVKPATRTALEVIAQNLVDVPNGIVIEGHTDALQFGAGEFTNWDLSLLRANAARRILEEAGVPSDRIIQVTGYADRQLRNAEDPLDPSNRRVTVFVPYSGIGAAAADPGVGE